jgi:hypothetical protein
MRRLLRRANRGYRRTALVAVSSSALLVASLGGAPGAEGQQAAFSNGTAKATAVVANIAPGVGSLKLGITSGVAVSEIKNTVGQAQAKTLDLGLIGGTLTAEGCTGGAPILSQSDLPQALRVDSRNGNASAVKDELPVAGTAFNGGRKEVSATTDPTGRAISQVVETINGLLDIEGGKAEATTRVIKGEAREAKAQVSLDLNLGGFLKLSSLKWTAVHRTGSNPQATADFDLGTASLLGVPIPIDTLAQLEKVLNQTLAASGLSISFPHVERFTTPADLIRITPLVIQIKDSPLGAAALGPVLNLTRAQREELFNQIGASFCQAAGGLLVGDIALDIVSGTGFLAIELGGAEATTGELVLENPFGEDEGTVELPPATGDLPSSVLPDLPPAITPSGEVQQPVAEVGPLEDRCESAHPLRRTSCSKGALMAVGVVGLLATAGVGALDWQHERRKRAKAGAATEGGS